MSDALPEPHLIEVELRIITWLPTRLSFADVGERVGLPAEAVKETVIALYRKLGVVNREEAVLRCVDLNLLSSAMASQSTEAITLPDTTDLQSSLEDLDEPFMQMRAVRDRDGRIVDFEYQYCNRAVLDALGRRREEMIGRCLLELYPAVATHWLFEAFVTVTNDGEARRYEFPFNEYGVVGDFEITLSRHGDGLVEHPDPPVERCLDQVVSVLKLDPEYLAYRLADHVVVAEPGQLTCAPPRAQNARLSIADEERRVR